MRGEATRADNYAALAKRVNMAVDRSHLIESRALDAEQLKMDRQKIFRDDVETGAGQEVIDVVASNMGIGARLALVGDLVDGHPVLEQNPSVPPAANSCQRRGDRE